MAYEITPQMEAEMTSYYAEVAQMLGGLASVGTELQRYEDVTGPDGQEYTKIVYFSPHDV